jgi:hypothetical protein
LDSPESAITLERINLVKLYIKLATAFMLAIGSLMLVTMPSQAACVATDSRFPDVITCGASDVLDSHGWKDGCANIQPRSYPANASGVCKEIDTTGLARAHYDSCTGNLDCLIYEARMLVKSKRESAAFDKAQAKALKAQEKEAKASLLHKR